VTVAELIEKLKEFPQDATVEINTDDYGPAPVDGIYIEYDKGSHAVIL
jgi:hypothetical protein